MEDSISDDEDMRLFLSQSFDDDELEISSLTGTIQVSPLDRASTSTSTPARTKDMQHKGQSAKKILSEILSTQKEILEIVRQNQTQLKELDRKLEEKAQEVITVPAQVRNAIHEGFGKGKDRGLNWIYLEKRFSDEVNDGMTDYIKTYVRGIYPEVKMAVVEVGMKRYFTSQKEGFNRKRKNQDQTHRVRQRSYERKKEKSKRRLVALNAKQWPEEKKRKIEPAFEKTLMSSDEELEDGSLSSQPPSWESTQFRMMKDALDQQYLALASDKTKRLLSKRTIGRPVFKENPKLNDSLKWIVRSGDAHDS